MRDRKLYILRTPEETQGVYRLAYASGPLELADLLDSEEDPSLFEFAEYKEAIAFELIVSDNQEEARFYGQSACLSVGNVADAVRWKPLVETLANIYRGGGDG